MKPILLQWGPITLYSYGLLMAMGFLAASWQAARAARRWPGAPPVPEDRVVNLTSAVLLAGVLGARALFVLTHADAFHDQPLEIFAIWHGGLIWYGGLLGGLVGVLVYARRRRLSPLAVLDQFAPAAALGHAIGRIGCFFNGCCYGVPTTAWWGVRFPGHDEPVVPTQLVESAGLLLLFLGLRQLQRASVLRRPGTVFMVYLLAYAVLRFVIEFWRGDQPHLFTRWTPAQFISMGLGIAAGIWLASGSQRNGAHLPSHRGAH